MSERSADLAGVVLAAGLGTRLAPLTTVRPKALVPVGSVPLLTWALRRLAPLAGSGAHHLAVNAHHHADAVVEAVGGGAHTSREGQPLGTAGALGAMAGWIEGRDVLVTNADAWMPDPSPALEALVAPWDGRRCRLLCAQVGEGERADFMAADGRRVRYVGTALLPGRLVSRLTAEPSGLYEVMWRREAAAGRLDVHVASASTDRPVAVDCGTPGDYLRANLLESGGASVVGKGALVEGRLVRSVVWDGAYVGPQERLVDAVRAGTREHPVTVRAA